MSYKYIGYESILIVFDDEEVYEYDD